MARVPQPWMHFRSLEDFRHEIDDVFSRSLGAAQQASLVPRLPPTESFLDGNEYVIRLDLPGIDSAEIEVTVMENVVTVRGSREHHDKQESWDVIHCELTHGDFERKLRLPQEIRTEDIKAAYKHGVLELRMPAPKEAHVRKVPIQLKVTNS